MLYTDACTTILSTENTTVMLSTEDTTMIHYVNLIDIYIIFITIFAYLEVNFSCLSLG